MSTGLKGGVILPLIVAAAIGFWPNRATESEFDRIEITPPLGAIVINANSVLQANPPSTHESAAKFLVYITAYSSSEDETDSTPHLTASGTRARDGVVAANVFPIGTRIKIPELFGDQIFVVEDRMHDRFADRIDVWMPSKGRALHFGKRMAQIEIVEL